MQNVKCKMQNEVEGFLEQVRKRFSSEVMMLFGSRAREEYLKQSDYDWIICEEKG